MNNAASLWLPEGASAISAGVDGVFHAYLWAAVVVLVVFTTTVLIFVSKYRRTRPDQKPLPVKENFLLPAAGCTVMLIIVLGVFICGLRKYIRLQVAPNSAVEIGVAVQEGKWGFIYPLGTSPDTLMVPAGRPVKLVMTAHDGGYALSIPAFRLNREVLPGRKTTAWFTVAGEGIFRAYNTAYSGAPASSRPAAVVKAVTPESYVKWNAVKFDPSIGKTPEEYGQYLYEKQGCNACHTLDGSVVLAPSFKALFGAQRALKSGETLIADEAYLKRSIVEPNVQVAAGFDPVMQAYSFKDKEMNALMAFIKSLK